MVCCLPGRKHFFIFPARATPLKNHHSFTGSARPGQLKKSSFICRVRASGQARVLADLQLEQSCQFLEYIENIREYNEKRARKQWREKQTKVINVFQSSYKALKINTVKSL